ncbi:MAG: peptidase M20, partial [Oscillospiraceae bacterium]|nr:peptidase M20 [Oscillospiraceae bacterium]
MLIAAVLAIFVAVILIRTLRFRPKVRPALSTEPVEFDRDRAVSNLAELIRCKTISYSDPSLEDDAEFEKLIGKLPALYPNVFEKCEFSRLP